MDNLKNENEKNVYNMSCTHFFKTECDERRLTVVLKQNVCDMSCHVEVCEPTKARYIREQVNSMRQATSSMIYLTITTSTHLPKIR